MLDEGHHIAKDEDSIAAAIKAVHEWFGEDENTDWLLILDNVDSQEFSLMSKKTKRRSFNHPGLSTPPSTYPQPHTEPYS